jgi:hypothetical protein
MKRISVIAVGVCVVAISVGCVRRTLTVRTEPEGASIWLNDEEVGKGPATVDFTWYGDYDIVCRKEGYETLETSHRLNPPWYQLPGIDFFAEVLTPWTYQDHHAVDLTLEPEQLPGRAELIERSLKMREEALYAED